MSVMIVISAATSSAAPLLSPMLVVELRVVFGASREYVVWPFQVMICLSILSYSFVLSKVALHTS